MCRPPQERAQLTKVPQRMRIGWIEPLVSKTRTKNSSPDVLSGEVNQLPAFKSLGVSFSIYLYKPSVRTLTAARTCRLTCGSPWLARLSRPNHCARRWSIHQTCRDV